MRNHYFLYSDIDNTLIHGTDSLSLQMRRILRRFTKRGNRFGVVTTRGFLRAKKAVGDLPNLPYIVLNGGEVYDTIGRCIHTFPISHYEKTLIKNVIIKKYSDISLIAYYPAGMHTAVVYVKSDRQAKQVYEKFPYTFLSFSDIMIDIRTYVAKLMKTSTCMLEIHTISGGFSFPVGLNVSMDGYFYITHESVDKASTLDYITKTEHITRERLVTCGDSDTDKKFLEWPNTLSVAVSNPLIRSKIHCTNEIELHNLVETLSISAEV